MSPLSPSVPIVPSLVMAASVSSTRNTRSLPTMPICSTLKRSASCRMGRNSMLMKRMKAKRSPKLATPESTSFTPYQTSRAREMAERISTTGKKML